MDPARWRIREYRPGDEAQILVLFNQVFGEASPTFEPRSLAVWRWQFEANPLGHHTLVAEDPDGHLVGNYASVRVPLLCNGREAVAAQIVDVCALPAYRGTGLFVAMANGFIERFFGPGGDLVQYGYPNPLHIRVAARHRLYLRVHGPVCKLVQDFAAPAVERLRHDAEGLSVAQLDRLDDRVDALWTRLRSQFDFAIRRDRRYLHWRYEQHPAIRYRYLSAHGPGHEMLGLAVIRLGWFDHPVLPIVDWLVPRHDARVAAALVAEAARIALAAGGTRVETWLPPASPERQHLLGFGFVDEEVPFDLMITRVPPALTLEWIRERWFYTMGDADFY